MKYEPRSEEEMIDYLFAAIGDEEALKRVAARMVDAGDVTCPCGKPDCEVNRAIQAEIAKRKAIMESTIQVITRAPESDDNKPTPPGYISVIVRDN